MSAPPLQVEAAPRHGLVRVQGNRILVTDPEGVGWFPSIWVPEDSRLRVAVNGKPVSGQVVLTQSDKIEVHLQSAPPSKHLQLQESPDHMEVVMRIHVHPGVSRRLADSEAANHVTLQVVETPVPPVPYSYEELRRALEDAGYQGRVDEDALRELAAGAAMERTVVYGIPPCP
ncbi:MAG: hypothetical protein K6T30_00355, partial [Alicyclobacillus sp.]|nr:hypothetical protein [Alicyclobacillus sp.]